MPIFGNHASLHLSRSPQLWLFHDSFDRDASPERTTHVSSITVVSTTRQTSECSRASQLASATSDSSHAAHYTRNFLRLIPERERGFVVLPDCSFPPGGRHSLSNAERPLHENKNERLGWSGANQLNYSCRNTKSSHNKTST